jgi:hypothetical protein
VKGASLAGQREPLKYAGEPLRELVFKELDDLMDILMNAKLANTIGSDEFQAYKHKASGIALALAIFTSPYNPSVDAVRAEAIERWEARQA